MKDHSRDVVSVTKFSGVTIRKIRQELAWTTGYSLIAISVAAGVSCPVAVV